MNKYFSKILLLLLCITFLGNNVRAEEPVSGGSSKFPILFMGIMAAGLSKFAYNYIHNRNIQLGLQKQLQRSVCQGPKNFSFQEYRTTNYDPCACWKTAYELLAKITDVQDVMNYDIGQGDRIYINGEPCKLTVLEKEVKRAEEEKKKITENINSNDNSASSNSSTKSISIKRKADPKEEQKKIIQEQNKKIRAAMEVEKQRYEQIKNALSEELTSLNATIQQLVQYTDVYIHIENLVNNARSEKNYGWVEKAKKYPITCSGNLIEYSITFSKFTPADLNEFSDDLATEIRKHNRWWKKLICPRYEKLSDQYWQFVQRYVRVYALKYIIDNYYGKIIQRIQNFEDEMFNEWRKNNEK